MSSYPRRASQDVDWLTRAACRHHDPDWWTVAAGADRQGRRNNVRARRICESCPVLPQCDEQANRLGSPGVIAAGRTIGQRGEIRPPRTNDTSCHECGQVYQRERPWQRFCCEPCGTVWRARAKAAREAAADAVRIDREAR